MKKKIGIHQINYFPWIGFFNKIAKSDIFVYLDEVQLSIRALTRRTMVMDTDGTQKYLNVGIEKKGYTEKKFSEILLLQNSDWQRKCFNFLKTNYSKAPFFEETMELILPVFEKQYNTLLEVNMESINIIKNALDIKTPCVFQSDIEYDRSTKNSDMNLAITKALGGEVYLSGRGAKEYMNLDNYRNCGVQVQYQTFNPFSYNQIKSESFVSGLSTIDMLYNMGIENSRELFWDNLQLDEKDEICDI